MRASPIPSESAATRTPGADIIDSIDVPIVAVGADCAVSRFNPAAATLLALTPANLGGSLREIPILMNVKNLEELCGEAIASGASSQCEARDATSGSWFVLRIAPYLGSEQRPVGAVLTLQNVTAFRASLEQAIYEREYTKAIVNTVVDPLVVLDDDCRVQAANQAFYETFQVSRQQAQGARLYDIGSRDWEIPRLESFLKEIHANNQCDPLEFEHEFPTLGRRTVLLNARRLSQGGNRGKMILLAIQDISERKQREERYRILAENLEVAVRARTQELEERNVDLQIQSERLRAVSLRLLQAQDEERRRIARNLHDSAGQFLVALAMNLASLANRARQESPQLVHEIADSDALVQELSRELRTTSYLLHPPLLDETGLGGALRWYIDGAKERSGLDIQLSIPEDFERLPAEMELVIFRLVQESLTNIHRHSGGKAAEVRLSREADVLCLEVQDDGKGIPHDKLSKIRSEGSGGVGINGMRERVRHFDGQLDIQSNGNGTTISARFPSTRKQASSEESVQQLKTGA